MDGLAGNTIKEMPKRARKPPKKMGFYELDPSSPKEDSDGLFVFLTFEDGYTAKIFNVCDVLSKDEKPITGFRDLKPGEEVFAKWSDNKFYNATVDFVGTADKIEDAKKAAKKDMKKRDAAAQRFYSPPSLPQVGQSTSAQNHPNTEDHAVIQPPTARPVDQPPPTESSLLIQPQHQPVTAWPQYQLPVSQATPQTHPYYQHPPVQPFHQYAPILSSVTHRSSLSQYPKHHQPHTALPTSSDLSPQPVLVDLDQQRQPPAPAATAKDSFLKMLYSPNTHPKPAVLGDQSQTSISEHETSSSSSGDTFIIQRDPIPECGEPCFSSPESTEDGSWKPCRACKAEVDKLQEEKAKLQDVLCGLSGEHLKAFKSFLDKVEQIQPQAGVGAPKSRSEKQELYPESGLFLSSTRLAAIHAEAKKDCLRLFHLLFDEFFTAEECRNTVAFGKHGKVPDGKTVLEKFKVSGILTYIMRCGTLDGWTPVEKSKVKKAFINKCRIRATTL
ncbi:RNA-binding protein 33-like [Salarias fasciatus]|uniref:RNA-binding protein 33-like n=1 Tax=Salarias fasciatus TaxID=181472 RepID=UPI001176AC10|nr:RNA-binding protein 33-like [Salarias fasciatus]